MNLIDQIEVQLQGVRDNGLWRRRRVTSSACGPAMTVDEREVVQFCSNDYLGLASHPALVQAVMEGAARYGAGSGASHLLSGHTMAHVLLEQKLQAWLAGCIPQCRALTYSTGYMANMGLLSALADRETFIYSDQLNHASLIDGMRLARAQVRIYPHRDFHALEAMLVRARAGRRMVVTDGVFSMDGDLAPLPELLGLCERHDAWLIVDDAHGLGVLGNTGAGVIEHFNLHSPRLILMGTLGKAAGVAGAFVAAHASVIEWLIQRSRQYIFTTAAPPALAHALLTSLELVEGATGQVRRAHLVELAEQFQSQLALRRWSKTEAMVPIQPVYVGDNDETVTASQLLFDAGYWVPAIRPPTVPPGTARMRVSLCATHTREQVAGLAQALCRIESRSDAAPNPHGAQPASLQEHG